MKHKYMHEDNHHPDDIMMEMRADKNGNLRPADAKKGPIDEPLIADKNGKMQYARE